MAKQTRIYFNVLIEILNKYFEEKQQSLNHGQIGQQIGGDFYNQTDLIDSKQFLFQTINRLHYYESTEKRNSLMEDYTLIGFFDVIRIFIENCINSLTSEQFSGLANILLEKCLFCINFNPLQSHIVQNVNLE